MLADPRSLFPSCWFCNFAIKVIKPTSMIYFVLLSSIYCACSVFLVSKRAYSDVSLTRSYPYFWLPKLLSGRTAEGRNQNLVCYHSFYSQATPNSTSNVCLSDTLILLISYCSTASFYDSIFTHRSDVVETGRQRFSRRMKLFDLEQETPELKRMLTSSHYTHASGWICSLADVRC